MSWSGRKPGRNVHWRVEANDDLIVRTADTYPTRFAGVAARARWPEPAKAGFDEIDR